MVEVETDKEEERLFEVETDMDCIDKAVATVMDLDRDNSNGPNENEYKEVDNEDKEDKGMRRPCLAVDKKVVHRSLEAGTGSEEFVHADNHKGMEMDDNYYCCDPFLKPKSFQL